MMVGFIFPLMIGAGFAGHGLGFLIAGEVGAAVGLIVVVSVATGIIFREP